MRKRTNIFYLNKTVLVLIVSFSLLMSDCNDQKKSTPALFEVLDAKKTGLSFENKLTITSNFNMFNYMYFYNGAGVGAGDFNNDGLTDLFFASNQGRNTLYLNKGKLSFSDVTAEAQIPDDKGWSTGVSVVDINNDGLLDIYICRVGKYEVLNSHNQFLICKGINKNGVPFYEDEAKKYRLDFSGFSSQALFLDYDLDGDLDMFLLNHSVHQNGMFAPRGNFIGTYDPLSGDRIFRNDDTIFTDVTKQTGINSSAISYGLGIACSDINLDGWPDLYCGNDFHENDYLYINQKNGTFSEETNERLMHTSKFSMGVDIADANNDGYPEIISMDMLPSDPYILKRSLGDDEYDIFYQKIDAGYNYQYSRNNLQYNRRNGMFSEIGLYSGVYATDWSWAPLFMDFDNDGTKDLFISNGIPKRLNDMDYINFISNEEIQDKLRRNEINDRNMALVKKLPEIKIPNKFFSNNGDMKFTDMGADISDNRSTYSNGAVYADLDNDGDLDIVVNNIDDPALIYENKSNDKRERTYASIKLKGPEKNINGVGAKIVQFENGSIHVYESYPVRGFLSSMQTPMHIGLYKIKTDSAFLVWPDNTYQAIQLDTNSNRTIIYSKGLPTFNYSKITSYKENEAVSMTDITENTGLQYRHVENTFVEFNREPLLPHMISSEGPALAVGDMNNDGKEDVFIGASKGFHNAIFLQESNGKFRQTVNEDLLADSMYEDVSAVLVDVNNDKYADLVIASGGNEYYGTDKHLLPRVYLNDGKAHFKRKDDAFAGIYMTASCVEANDFNRDGFIDLFIGGRAMPWAYGQIPPSYLLQNDGTGKFTDVTNKYAKDLKEIGMVTNASWVDIDKDGDNDLLVCCEWGGIYAFINNNGSFTKKSLTDKKGWWNFILPFDADGDGDMDLLAGNLGLNSRLKASDQQPIRMYYNDFDDNEKKEQIITYFVNNKEIPFATKEEIIKQMPPLKKKFLYAEDYARSTPEKMFSENKLQGADKFEANYFSNAILINDGHMNFTVTALPWEAQLSSYRDAVIVNANDDKYPDIFLAGNYYDNNIQMGRYDADFGTLLINSGNNLFTCEKINNCIIKGQVRHVKEITIGKEKALILAKNNDSLKVIKFKLPGNKF
ncbi:MAG: hypothetical protein E6H08_14390 [Bacteroidetes bacterium]|nr:MAG: hypothetical protein E6H08_14390 [Bacteroidota bacterium]